jgi:predicted permease
MADEVEGDVHELVHRWSRGGTSDESGDRATSARVGLAWLRGVATVSWLIPRLACGRALDSVRRGSAAGWSLDGKLALRLLWRHPGLSLISVFALAATMALATSLFTLTTAALYSDLPVPDGDRIVLVDLRDQQTRRTLYPTWGEYRAFRDGTASMDHVGAFSVSRLNLGREDVPVQAVPGAWITPSLFRFNPVVPLLGSLITEEMVAEDPHVALLGEDVWATMFGRDPDVVGQYVEVNGTEHRIIGVLPDTWRFPADESLWVPLLQPAGATAEDQFPGAHLIGRIAEGSSMDRATAEATSLIRPATPLPDRTPAIAVRPYARGFSDPAEIPLFWTAVSALVLLVLVAAANVANLVLARTEARQSELAVRSALGASRGRIVGQLFVEAFALTGIAAVLAVTLSSSGLRWMTSVVPGLPYYMDLSPRPVVIGFAVVLAGLAAVFAGVVPALRSTSRGMADGVRGTRSVGFGRLSQGVIVAEIALSVALLGGAFALGQSFLGYTRGSVTELADDRIVTATLYTPWEGELAEQGDVGEFDAGLRESVRGELERELGVPVGFTLDLPGTEAQTSRVEIEGENALHVVRGVSVDDGFFDVVDVGASPGRVFDRGDFVEGAAPVLVVNQPFVDDVLEGRNAVGQRLRFHYGDGSQGDWGEVVGVVPDLGMNPGDPMAGAAVYRRMAGSNYTSVLARADGRDPFELVPAMRAAAFAFDARVQLRDPRLLRDAARDQRALLSGLGSALFLMGAMALLLSGAGLYAVISFGIASRTREIGVRVALGADAFRVVRTVAMRVARNLGVGLVVGLGLGWLLLQGVGVLEFTIRVNPLLHLGVPAVLLLLAGLVSVWRPLRRALAIQPAEALRAD